MTPARRQRRITSVDSIEARYPGMCICCRGEVQPGDTLYPGPFNKWLCAGCYDNPLCAGCYDNPDRLLALFHGKKRDGNGR